MGISSFFNYVGGMATFAQVLLALPMALDLLGESLAPRFRRTVQLKYRPAGPPSFLFLSLLFTIHHFAYSTLRLILKNTALAPLISILSFLSPFISGSLILVTLYYYLYPPSAAAPGSLFSTFSHVLVDVLPFLYASILRWVSPLFTLLEGISTLLVIQVTGRVGKGWADEEEKEEGIEWRSLAGLVLAALVYCAGLAGVAKVSDQGQSQ